MGATLRQVLGLLIEQPRVLLGVAAAAIAPGALCLAAILAASPFPRGRAGGAQGMSAGLAFLLALLGGTLAGGSVLLPVVAQVLATPLRPLELRPLLRARRERAGEYARFVGWFVSGYVLWVLLPAAGAAAAVLALLPSVPIAWRGWVIVPVFVVSWVFPAVWIVRISDLGFAPGAILMEGLALAPALERSRTLAVAAKRDLRGFEALRAALMLSGVILGLAASTAGASFLKSIGAGWGVGALAGLDLCGLAVLAAALTFTIGALQYFKARQSAGEPLVEVLARFERQALPSGYWQQRVHERIRQQVEASR